MEGENVGLTRLSRTFGSGCIPEVESVRRPSCRIAMRGKPAAHYLQLHAHQAAGLHARDLAAVSRCNDLTVIELRAR